MANTTRLTAVIAETSPLRFTPAGLPALDVRLEHESQLEEAGSTRSVRLALKAVALGAVAERLVKQSVGSQWQFSGFLASPRNAKSVVLHIQDFQQDQFQGASHGHV